LADKASRGKAGNGIPTKANDCIRGADPPKNVSGRTNVVRSFETIKGDLRYAIMAFERNNDIFYALLGLRVPRETSDGDGEGWPDKQCGLRGGIAVAGKQQVQMPR